MEADLTCIKCGKKVSDREFKERYEALVKLGIVPMMVVMCKECRGEE